MQFTDMVRSCLVELCRSYGPFNGQVEIDAIIYISSLSKQQNAVIKVREVVEVPLQNGQTVQIESCFKSDSDDIPLICDDVSKASEVNDLVSKQNVNNEINFEKSFEEISQLANFETYCKICAYGFSSRYEYLQHCEINHKFSTCPICFKTFTSRSNMDRHFRLHTGQRPYDCNMCQRSFTRKDHLSTHMAKHLFMCSLCLFKNPHAFNLNSHFIMAHKLPLISICKFCKIGFGKEDAFKEHFKIHWSSLKKQHTLTNRFHNNQYTNLQKNARILKGYKNTTNITNENSTNLSNFINSQNNLKKDLFEPASFYEHAQPKALNENSKHVFQLQKVGHLDQIEHNKTKEYNKNNLNIITQPGTSNNSEENESSTDAVNNKTSLFNQSLANEKEFKNNKEENIDQPLDPKIKRTSEFEEKDHSSDIINISSEISIRKHSFTDGFHNGEPIHPCSICNEICSSFNQLNHHSTIMHKRSPCCYCSKTFAQKANRDRHHCLHTGDKPYACSHCGEKFPRSDKLKIHLARVHNNVLPTRFKRVVRFSCHKQLNKFDEDSLRQETTIEL